MDIKLADIVIEKLEKYQLTSLGTITEKNMSRLIVIEEYIQKNANKTKILLKEIKHLELTKVGVASCDEIKISRKTIYNEKNNILRHYIENSILEKEDYFNEKKMIDLKNQLNEFKIIYEKILDKVIEVNTLKLTMKHYETQAERLMIENENLYIISAEKDKVIKKLQAENVKHNNILELKEFI